MQLERLRPVTVAASCETTNEEKKESFCRRRGECSYINHFTGLQALLGNLQEYGRYLRLSSAETSDEQRPPQSSASWPTWGK